MLAGAALPTTACEAWEWKTRAPYDVRLDVVSEGYDGKTCWFHPRAGAIPGKTPVVVMTLQKWDLQASDLFLPLQEMRSEDLGGHWSAATDHSATLGRRAEPNGVEVGVCDFTPKWHARSGVLLGTGHTVRYRANRLIAVRPRETAYSVYDPTARTWANWSTLKMPDEPRFQNSGAGSTQRVDLPDGDILLPIYFKELAAPRYASAVARCGFDGKQLVFKQLGTPLSVPTGRGLYEPSLALYKGRYYLTMRNDTAAYVSVSRDGLQFDEPRMWKWDDTNDLGSYNTQQHWVTHADGLFLAYTRRGADNDNVVRHRAPLFIGEIDTDELTVIRISERVLVPSKGAQLGNFAVTDVNERETWVTTSEGMSPRGSEKFGANGRVYAARIQWKRRNGAWNRH